MRLTFKSQASWRRRLQICGDTCHTASKCVATFHHLGLRFFKNGELQLQASICWECNNIFGDAKGDDFWYEFDAQHNISQKLLALCKQVFELRQK